MPPLRRDYYAVICRFTLTHARAARCATLYAAATLLPPDPLILVPLITPLRYDVTLAAMIYMLDAALIFAAIALFFRVPPMLPLSSFALRQLRYY